MSRRRWSSQVKLTMTAAAMLLIMSGCGIPLDDEPRDLSSEDGVGRLVISERNAAAASSDSPVIFLVDQASDGDQFVAVRRDTKGTPTDVIEALLEGPTTEDRDANRGSAIPNGLTLLQVTPVSATVIRIDLRIDASSPGLQGERGITAIGQMVFTATSLPCVRGVLFSLNGEARPLSDENGIVRDAPLTRDDFASRRPPFSATESRRDDSACA
ncbi:MAG: GerMN domain-containing protein [Acidimicrobiia bacterium]